MKEPIFVVKNKKQLEEATGLISSFDNAFINKIDKVDCVSHAKIAIELEEQKPIPELHLPKAPVKVQQTWCKVEYETYIMYIPKLDKYPEIIFDL